MTPLSDCAWEEVSAGFYGPLFNDEYLVVIIDDYSRYPEVEIISSLSAKSVIPKFDAIFARHSIPKVVKTDNDPPFIGETFNRWGEAIGFRHRKITFLRPRATGLAERSMDTLEKIIRISHAQKISWKQEMFKFLRHYRATPHSTTGITSAEMLFNRKIRTDILSVKIKKVRFKDPMIRDEQMKEKMKKYADERYHASETPETNLKLNDTVLVKQKQTSKSDMPFNLTPFKAKTIKRNNGDCNEQRQRTLLEIYCTLIK